MNKYGSLNDIKDDDFPGFYTVKKIVILIDGCLNIPFYQRDKNNFLKDHEINECWFNESDGLADLNLNVTNDNS